MNLLENNSTGQNPFKVPDGYFDALPSLIQEKISNQRKMSYFKSHFFYKPVAIAAVVIAVFFLVWIYNFPEKNVLSETIAQEDLFQSGYINEIDDQLLAEVIDENNFYSDPEQPEADYLINNEIDINTLIEYL